MSAIFVTERRRLGKGGPEISGKSDLAACRCPACTGRAKTPPAITLIQGAVDPA